MKIRDIAVGVIIAALIVGCAGRAANPIMIQQYGDDKKTCQGLEREMAFIQSEMQRLIPQTEKTGKNTALGVAGFFLIVPLFFMDLSKAEQIEVDACRQRYNHLLIIAGDKQCGIQGEQIQDFGKQTNSNTPPSNTTKP